MAQSGAARSRAKTTEFVLAVLVAACGGGSNAPDVHVADAASTESDVHVSDSGLSEPDARVADASSETACVWGVNELLAEINQMSFERTNCGGFNGLQDQQVTSGLACLLSIPMGHGGELTVNYCIDCAIPSTYVIAPTGDLFHIRMEEDYFGDNLREASVERCSGLVERGSMIECVDGMLLYSCQARFR